MTGITWDYTIGQRNANMEYTKVLDQACREIRHGRLERDHGRAIVNYHERIEPGNSDLLLDWLGIDRKTLDFCILRHEVLQL